MKKELDMVVEFHKKFRAPIGDEPTMIPEDRSGFRNKFMTEEVSEYIGGVLTGDIANVAKELADILYVVYGTIVEHGLRDKMEDIFAEVHRSNMSKEYGDYKMVKGENYFKADIKTILDEEGGQMTLLEDKE